MEPDTLPLSCEQDIVLARQAVRRLTAQLAFSLVDQTKMVTAASELARNAVVHGRGGVLKWEILTKGDRAGLRLQFIDHGPGIADLTLAMKGGWSSGTGLGLGLSGSKRLVNEFDIQTAPNAGTVVTVTRWT